MQPLIQDIRYSLRQLRKSPGFTLTAVLTLALGIGANAAIFTLVHAVLLRNLPVADPKTLVRVGDTDDCCINGVIPDNNDYSIFSYELYKQLRDNTPEFEQLAATQAGNNGMGSITARRGGDQALPRAASAQLVSGNYFLTFGLRPQAGRLLAPSDDVEGAPTVAVLSYRSWQQDYAADPSVVGSTFVLNTHPVTIIGITPSSFYGDRMTDSPPDFYVPLAMEPVMGAWNLLHRPESNWLYLLGRLRPGGTLAAEQSQLQAKMSGTLRRQLASVKTYASEEARRQLPKTHVVLTPGGLGIANMQQEYGHGLQLLMVISALVLLIACANIANLVLVRGMGRRTEISVRMALGAPRSRIVRQMLTESLVLACGGGLFGLIVAYAGTRMLLSLAFPDANGLPIDASPSPAVLIFAFGLSLLTGLIFGSAPAWITSHSQPAEALRGSNRSTRDNSSLLQRSLVILQAALSLVLLLGAGLLTKSLDKLQHQNFGLETENRIVAHIRPEQAGYKNEQLQPLYDQIEQRLMSEPGVEHVGLSTYTPLEGNSWSEIVYFPGRPDPGLGAAALTSWTRVSPNFFTVIGQHVLRGRGITAQDTATSPLVAVVNQAFVKKFVPDGQDPIGKRFGLGDIKSASEIEIVGVVSDVKYNHLTDPMRAMYFRPLLQHAPLSDGPGVQSLYAGALMLQTKGPVEGLESRVRETLKNINPNLTVVDFKTFDDQIGGQFTQERLVARLTLMFSLLALVLASLGLYGVTAYTVARRTSEIGIRMALGAGRRSVMGMVMREAMLQVGVGLVIGIPAALLCSRFVKTQLYGVAEHDFAVMAAAILALLVSAFIAGLVPARRAAWTEPMQALRSE